MGGNAACCERPRFLEGAEVQAGIERWDSYVSRCEKQLKDKLDDEKDARLEIMTHVEAKFGLRIRDSKPSDAVSRGQVDLMDDDAVNSR